LNLLDVIYSEQKRSGYPNPLASMGGQSSKDGSRKSSRKTFSFGRKSVQQQSTKLRASEPPPTLDDEKETKVSLDEEKKEKKKKKKEKKKEKQRKQLCLSHYERI